METGELHNFLVFTWITVFWFNMAIPLGKVAVAAFLIEMNAQSSMSIPITSCLKDDLTSKPVTDLKIRRSLLAFAAVNIIVNIPQIILVWFQCDPPDALWDPHRQHQCHYSINANYTYFVGAVAAVTDFYFAIIPITMLTPLRLDMKLKVGLCLLMGLGVFAGAAAIVRSWAAKFVTAEDSSCKNLSPCLSFNPDRSHRWCGHAFPLGRGGRMDRPDRHVDSAHLATFPAVYAALHQDDHLAEPVETV